MREAGDCRLSWTQLKMTGDTSLLWCGEMGFELEGLMRCHMTAVAWGPSPQSESDVADSFIDWNFRELSFLLLWFCFSPKKYCLQMSAWLQEWTQNTNRSNANMDDVIFLSDILTVKCKWMSYWSVGAESIAITISVCFIKVGATVIRKQNARWWWTGQ